MLGDAESVNFEEEAYTFKTETLRSLEDIANSLKSRLETISPRLDVERIRLLIESDKRRALAEHRRQRIEKLKREVASLKEKLGGRKSIDSSTTSKEQTLMIDQAHDDEDQSLSKLTSRFGMRKAVQYQRERLFNNQNSVVAKKSNLEQLEAIKSTIRYKRTELAVNKEKLSKLQQAVRHQRYALVTQTFMYYSMTIGCSSSDTNIRTFASWMKSR